MSKELLERLDAAYPSKFPVNALLIDAAARIRELESQLEAKQAALNLEVNYTGKLREQLEAKDNEKGLALQEALKGWNEDVSKVELLLAAERKAREEAEAQLKCMEGRAELAKASEPQQPVATYHFKPESMRYGIEWHIDAFVPDGTKLYAGAAPVPQAQPSLSKVQTQLALLKNSVADLEAAVQEYINGL